MPRIEKRILINVGAERVFSLLTDFRRWPEIFPNMVGVPEITEKDGQTRFKWVYKMMGLRVKGEVVIIESVPNQRLVAEVKMVAHIHWVWALEERESQTQVTSTVEYKIPKWVFPKIAKSLSDKQQYERELDLVLHTIKQLVEVESGEG